MAYTEFSGGCVQGKQKSMTRSYSFGKVDGGGTVDLDGVGVGYAGGAGYNLIGTACMMPTGSGEHKRKIKLLSLLKTKTASELILIKRGYDL